MKNESSECLSDVLSTFVDALKNENTRVALSSVDFPDLAVFFNNLSCISSEGLLTVSSKRLYAYMQSVLNDSIIFKDTDLISDMAQLMHELILRLKKIMLQGNGVSDTERINHTVIKEMLEEVYGEQVRINIHKVLLIIRVLATQVEMANVSLHAQLKSISNHIDHESSNACPLDIIEKTEEQIDHARDKISKAKKCLRCVYVRLNGDKDVLGLKDLASLLFNRMREYVACINGRPFKADEEGYVYNIKGVQKLSVVESVLSEDTMQLYMFAQCARKRAEYLKKHYQDFAR